MWERENREKAEYLSINLLYEGNEKRSWAELFFMRFGTWILMFTNFIPISLVVTIEFVRLIQGQVMTWDADIYD